MKESNSRREFLSQSGKMVTAAALFGTSVPLAHAAVAGTLNCEANNTCLLYTSMGLGIGLTPSADDYLTGLALVLFIDVYKRQG